MPTAIFETDLPLSLQEIFKKEADENFLKNTQELVIKFDGEITEADSERLGMICLRMPKLKHLTASMDCFHKPDVAKAVFVIVTAVNLYRRDENNKMIPGTLIEARDGIREIYEWQGNFKPEEEKRHQLQALKILFKHCCSDYQKQKFAEEYAFSSGSDLALDGVVEIISRINEVNQQLSQKRFYGNDLSYVAKALKIFSMAPPASRASISQEFYSDEEILALLESDPSSVNISSINPVCQNQEFYSEYLSLLSGLNQAPKWSSQIMQSRDFSEMKGREKLELLESFSKVLTAVAHFADISDETKKDAAEQQKNIDTELNKAKKLLTNHPNVRAETAHANPMQQAHTPKLKVK